jgi:hypothetical protein
MPTRVRIERQGLDINAAVTPERVRANAAMRGDVLILLADRFSENIDLDLAGRLCKRSWGDRGAPCVRKSSE